MEKKMRWLKRLLLAVGQVEVAICHKKGFPLGDSGATGPCSWLSWQLEVGTPETFSLLLVAVHPSTHLTKVYSSILSVQPYYHKWLLRFGGLGLLSFAITQLTAELPCAGGWEGTEPALSTTLTLRYKLFSISSGLRWGRKPWHLDKVPFFWMRHQFPTPRSFKRGDFTHWVLSVGSGGQFTRPSCAATAEVLGLPPSPTHHPIALHVLC